MKSADSFTSEEQWFLQTLAAVPEAELERRLAEVSLADFVQQAWHVLEPSTPLVWGWHLDALCLHLKAVLCGDIQNLYIAVPPGTTKTTVVSVMFPAWVWATKPELRFLTAANEGTLATRDSLATRRLIESDWYRARWANVVRLTSDQNIKSYYENDRRGHRQAITVASRTTGKKGDLLLVDDAHDAAGVESEADRKAVRLWWDKAFYNRVNDPKTARRIVVGQRLHADDLYAHILAAGFEELRIPEEYESENPCATSIGWRDPRAVHGELLRPERFGPAEVAEALATLGSTGYAAQHQQRPVPAEGALFKKAWLRYYVASRDSDGWLLGDRVVLRRDCRWFATVDLAVSTKTTADYTVIAIWADDRKGTLILANLIRGRFEGPDIAPKMRQAWEEHDLDFLAVESVGFQLTIIQEARRKGLPIRELPRDKDKISRALPATVKFEAGQVWFPRDAPWIGILEEELLTFPAGRHDDCVDAVADGVLEMLKLYRQGGASLPRAFGGVKNVAPMRLK